jgi:hypothetical protein
MKIMGYSIDDVDPVWSDMVHSVRIWATSKISFNRYVNDAKLRFNLLFSCDCPIYISKIDHVEIVRNEARYYFKEKVSKYSGQFSIDGLYYHYCNNCVIALDLKK